MFKRTRKVLVKSKLSRSFYLKPFFINSQCHNYGVAGWFYQERGGIYWKKKSGKKMQHISWIQFSVRTIKIISEDHGNQSCKGRQSQGKSSYLKCRN